MSAEMSPTAAESYTRTLVRRGCPPLLAAMAGKILARLDSADPTPEEQALIDRAYAHLSH